MYGWLMLCGLDVGLVLVMQIYEANRSNNDQEEIGAVCAVKSISHSANDM